MAMQVSELREWLATLQDTASVAIDDGGMILQVVDDPGVYIEVGGLPEERCEKCGKFDSACTCPLPFIPFVDRLPKKGW